MLTEAQLAVRKTGIGSSEIGAIAGWDPFKDRLEVWLEKVGWSTGHFDNAATLAGKWLEDGILARAAHDRDWILQRCLRTIRSPQYPWVLATPDRFKLIDVADAAGAVHRKRDRIVECKSSHAIDTVEGWGEEWSAKVPRHIRAQVQWQMTATGCRTSTLVVLFTFQDRRLRYFEVPHCQALEDALLELSDQFWHQHVVTVTPPEIDYARESAKRYLGAKHKNHDQRILPAPLAADAWIEQLQAANRELAAATERKAEAENHLKTMCADAKGIAGPWGRFTWSECRGKISEADLAKHLMDQTSMPEEQRSTLREQFRGASYRRVLLTPPKET